METPLRKSIYILIILCSLIIANYTEAEDKNPFLAEVQEFEVIIVNLPQNLIDAGLSTNYFKDKAEYFCRKNNLKVVKDSSNTLFVHISGLPLVVGERIFGYSYNIKMFFNQFAKTLETGEIGYVSSWVWPGHFATIEKHLLQNQIKQDLEDGIEDFSNAILLSHQ